MNIETQLVLANLVCFAINLVGFIVFKMWKYYSKTYQKIVAFLIYLIFFIFASVAVYYGSKFGFILAFLMGFFIPVIIFVTLQIWSISMILTSVLASTISFGFVKNPEIPEIPENIQIKIENSDETFWIYVKNPFIDSEIFAPVTKLKTYISAELLKLDDKNTSFKIYFKRHDNKKKLIEITDQNLKQLIHNDDGYITVSTS